MLSESLKGVIAQTLLKKIGGGRVAAHEIMLSIAAVANLIREGKTFQLPSVIQTNKRLGMITLNDSLGTGRRPGSRKRNQCRWSRHTPACCDQA